MKACMGRVLRVDLGARSFEELQVPEASYRKYLGGLGLAAALLFDDIPAGADPLGPDNVLCFSSGLLTGTGSVMTGRWMVSCKSPLTGGWGDANCGGTFSPAIKQCGWDAILFRGIASGPVVFVADAKGRFAVVERAPGEKAYARRPEDPARMAVTNHFEGPLRGDPRDDAVRAGTTSIDRRVRADELLGAIAPSSLDAKGAIALLRDHKCPKGIACDLGDRRSLDALIATHGVVADLTDKVLWVSRGPHLSGAFVRFDLARAFAKGHDPAADPPPETIDEDPILKDGRYDEGRTRALRPTAKQ